MAKLSDELLHKYTDNELSPAQKRQVEEQLNRSTEQAAEVARMKRLGELMKLMSDEVSSQVSFEGFAERVTAAVRAEQRPGFAERVAVFSREFLEHRRHIWVPAACAAAAVLAVVLTVPLLGTGRGTMDGTTPMWTASADGSASLGSRIDEVSFGDLRGTVYQIETSRGGTTGVVWIVE